VLVLLKFRIQNFGFENKRFEIILEYQTILKWPSLLVLISCIGRILVSVYQLLIRIHVVTFIGSVPCECLKLHNHSSVLF